MKKSFKTLALVMAVTMVLSCFFAAPATAASVSYNRVYPVTIDSSFTVSTNDEWVSVQNCAPGADYKDGNDHTKGVNGYFIKGNSYSGDKIITNDPHDYYYMPTVTYYVYAPETKSYSIAPAVSAASGIYQYLGVTVNDQKAYTVPFSGGYPQRTEISVDLVKGYNVIRMILRDGTAGNKNNSTWINFWYLDIDSSLTAAKNGGISLPAGSAQYKNYGSIGTNADGNLKLGDAQNVSDYYNKRTTDVYSSWTASAQLKDKDKYSNSGSYTPFFTYTVDVAEDGYYDMYMVYGSGSDFSSGYCILSVDGQKSGKFSVYRSGYDGTANFTTYLPAGTHTVTVTAPFGISFTAGNDPWFDMYYLVFKGRVGVSVADEQKDPCEEFGYVDLNAPTVTTSTATFAAYDYGIAAGQEYDYGASHKNENEYSLGGSYYTRAGYANSGLQTKCKSSEFSGKYVIGGLENVYRFANKMQTLRSMQKDEFLNKTYLPIVSYQVIVPKGGAGTYQVTAAYNVLLRYGYAYNDYYMVISANDNEYHEAELTGLTQREYSSGTGNGKNSKSSAGVYLNEGVNVIRCIAAVGENANSIHWIDQEGIIITGPSAVTAYQSNEQEYYSVKDSNTEGTTIYTNNFAQKYRMDNPRTGWVVAGHNLKAAQEKGIYYDNIDTSSALLSRVPYVAYTLNVPADGYFDIDLCFNTGGTTYASENDFILFVNGEKRAVHYKTVAAEANAGNDRLINNNCNLSTYLTAGENIIVMVCPLTEEYINGNGWTDFGAIKVNNITLASTQKNPEAYVSTKRLEAEEYGLASVLLDDTKQPNQGAYSKNFCVGSHRWDFNMLQSLDSMSNYIEKSTNHVLTFMVDAPEDGSYAIAPGYYLNGADVDRSKYNMTVVVNDNQVIQLPFVDRGVSGTATGHTRTETTVSLKKGRNVIRLIKGYGQMTQNCGWNARSTFINLDFLDIDNRLTGIQINRQNGSDQSKSFDTSDDTYIGVDLVTADQILYKNGYESKQETFVNYRNNETLTTDCKVLVQNETAANLGNTATSVDGITDISKVPYVSFTVTAPADGYYDISANFRPSTMNTFYWPNASDHDKYDTVLMYVDGQKKEVGFNRYASNVNDDTTAWSAYNFNVINYSAYLTAGTHVLVFTTCLAQNGTFYNDRMINYGRFELAGGLEYSGAESQIDPTTDTSEDAFNNYKKSVLERLEAFIDIPEVRNIDEIQKAIDAVSAIGYDSSKSLEDLFAEINAAANITPKLIEDVNDTRDEADYDDAFITYRKWAAAEARNLVYTGDCDDDCSVNGCPNPNDIAPDHSDHNLHTKAEAAAKLIEATNVSDSYTYGGKTYTKAEYKDYFNAILDDLYNTVVSQRLADFVIYRETTKQAAIDWAKTKYANDSETLSGVLKLIDDTFATIQYDGTTPYHIPHVEIDGLYAQIKESATDLERWRDLYKEKQEELTKKSDTEKVDGDTAKIDRSIDEVKEELKRPYDYSQTLEENLKALDDIYKDFTDKIDGQRNATKYQIGVWTQYQTKDSISSMFPDKDMLYVRFFFLLDTNNNNYKKFGFKLCINNYYWDGSALETDIDLTNKSVDKISEYSLSQKKTVDYKASYFDKNKNTFGGNYEGYADQFAFTYFVIPKDMYDQTFTIQAYFEDENGMHYSKVKTVDLRKHYGNFLPKE